jgi:hypothetical protein
VPHINESGAGPKSSPARSIETCLCQLGTYTVIALELPLQWSEGPASCRPSVHFYFYFDYEVGCTNSVTAAVVSVVSPWAQAANATTWPWLFMQT